MIYLTGDTHGNISRIEKFCDKFQTSKQDIIIILGDAGFNYYLNLNDYDLKLKAESLPITFFCIHGNHEERPQNISNYQEVIFHNGVAFQQEQFPSLYFAKDGEFYNFNKKQCLALGGAYSVDKQYRIAMGYKWYASEQPNALEKQRIEQEIAKHNYQTDIVLSHTCPYHTMPKHLFLKTIDQSKIDNSMELWFQEISEKLSFQHWYFGHYHADWKNNKFQMLFENIIELV